MKHIASTLATGLLVAGGLLLGLAAASNSSEVTATNSSEVAATNSSEVAATNSSEPTATASSPESSNSSESLGPPPRPPPASLAMSIGLKVVYLVGIVGNAVAIVCLRCGERRVRNRKHLLLITALAVNDLVALLGMLTLNVVTEAGGAPARALCAARVVMRVFGIGSGCIAVTMALERYLALTCVFLYQKCVTLYVTRWTLGALWALAALVTCLPLAGLGAFHRPGAGCVRYREAAGAADRAYAWFYVMLGLVLCAVLVYCNLAVIRALYVISAPGAGPPAVRRYSHASARRRHTFGNTSNAATAEEVAFSRLMARLSVLFLICWLPQMITSILYLSLPRSSWAALRALGVLSDVLMLLNYVLNPIQYVLMRQRRNICHTLADCFKRNHQPLSADSMKTSYCPDTQLASDSSAAPPAPLTAPLAAPLAPLATPLLRLDADNELKPLRSHKHSF